jgi:polysaccharide export outer membrane protein
MTEDLTKVEGRASSKLIHIGYPAQMSQTEGSETMKRCSLGLRRELVAAVILISFWFLVMPSESAAQEYTIGVEDVVSISFWQQPQLNITAKVAEDGSISLPTIGEVEASGLTKKELAERIVEKMSLYDPTISGATVIVSEYNSRRVYVQGEVLHPGKYSSENIPDLWELLGEAGGPTENADLSSVTIIRGGPKGGIINVDLERYLKSGDLSQLPKLKPKDTINIPRSLLSSTSSRPIPISLRTGKVYYLWGEVISPGAYPLESQIDLMEAISLAGGPTSLANLKKVKVMKKQESKDVVSIVNVDQYLKKGIPRGLVVDSDDIIIVPVKSPGGLSKAWGVFREVITVVGAGAGIYLLIDRLQEP